MKKLFAALVVAFAVVFLVTSFGDNVKSLFGMSADSLGGDGVVTRRTQRQGALEKKTLQNFGQDNFAYGDAPSVAIAPNPVTTTAQDARSTFAIDVDTASWTWARRVVLDSNQLPAKDGIRLEEWVNAFDYELAAPRTAPVAISVEGATSPFDEEKTLVKVALKGRVVSERQPAHLVFLVDVSGSMGSPDRLPLAKHALKVLTRQLNEKDTVSLVTYAGSTEVVLPATNGSRHDAIIAAIDSLGAGGGTAMGSGMELAYRLAVQQVAPKTTTRVLVLTDGDANIGANQSPEQILNSVHAYVEEGVTLTTVGFGVGNYRYDALEKLADKGNGQALYFSNEREVEKAFSAQVTSTLEVIAKDLKVQVTFDPAVVSTYRLLGYENRAIADDDFKNDRIDAGEMGSGHAVTALYEVTLTSKNAPLGTVAIRGAQPGTGERFELEQPITRAAVSHALAEQGSDFRFATAVALGADTLRGNAVGSWSLSAIAELAQGAANGNAERIEYVQFLRRAEQLRAMPVAQRNAPSNLNY